MPLGHGILCKRGHTTPKSRKEAPTSLMSQADLALQRYRGHLDPSGHEGDPLLFRLHWSCSLDPKLGPFCGQSTWLGPVSKQHI